MNGLGVCQTLQQRIDMPDGICYSDVMRLSSLIPMVLLIACSTRNNVPALAPITVINDAAVTRVVTPKPNSNALIITPTTSLATAIPLPTPEPTIAIRPSVATDTIKPTPVPIDEIKPSLTPTRNAAGAPTATPLPTNKVITSSVKSPDGIEVTQICFDALRNVLCQLKFANGAQTPTFLADTPVWSNSHYFSMPIYENYLSPPLRYEVWDVKQGNRIAQLDFKLPNMVYQATQGWGPNSDVLAYVLDVNNPRLMLLDATTGKQTAATDCPDWMLSQNQWSLYIRGQVDMTRLCRNYRPPNVSSTVVTQRFERGVMLWVQQNDTIYVLFDDQRLGVAWEPLRNKWFAGMPEQDTTIVPPVGKFQPVRGFGKEWRERFGQYGALRDALGWAIAPEKATLNAIVRCDFGPPATACYLPAAQGGWYRLERVQSAWEWVIE